MKALIVYCSDYKKNTEKIARIFAEKVDCELINIRDISDISIENYNLIGFGSGVYRESLSPKMFRLVDKLNLKCFLRQKFREFCYDVYPLLDTI